jgi:intracellular septation protein
MKLLLDFLPIIFFFATYKFYGIFPATAAAILVSALQITFIWFKKRRLEPIQIITFLMILILGGATLFLHNSIFIKWKPTVLYWVFAILFFLSQLIGKKPFIKYMLEEKISLPEPVWKKLNLSWIVFFSIVGLVNLYVVYNYSTDFWVNFKLFGIVGLTIIFGLMQSFFISKYIVEETTDLAQ